MSKRKQNINEWGGGGKNDKRREAHEKKRAIAGEQSERGYIGTQPTFSILQSPSAYKSSKFPNTRLEPIQRDYPMGSSNGLGPCSSVPVVSADKVGPIRGFEQ